MKKYAIRSKNCLNALGVFDSQEEAWDYVHENYPYDPEHPKEPNVWNCMVVEIEVEEQ